MHSEEVLKFYRAMAGNVLLYSKQCTRVKAQCSYAVSYKPQRMYEEIMLGNI